MKKIEIVFGILRIPIDILMTILAFISAYHLRTFTNLLPGITLDLNLSSFPPLNDYIQFSIIAGIFLFLLFALYGMYQLKSSSKISEEIGSVIRLSTFWMLIIITYFFSIRQFPFSRLALVYSFILTIVLISFGRILIHLIQHLLLKANIGRRKILFVGKNKISEDLKYIYKDNPRFTIVGIVNANQLDNLISIIKKKKVEEIIQTNANINRAHAKDILNICREYHLHYHFVPDLVQVQRTNIEISSPGGIPLISLKPTPLDGWGKITKRLFDITGSLFGLILFSPILLITAIIIKIDSKGDILFKYLDDGSRVKRVGQYGNLFNFYKFRSMFPNTHNLRYTKLAYKNIRKGSPMVKIKNDPRVTRVGKFIRKWSIDELPQLWNVFKGDMSLVGPRPHLPEEVAKYERHQKFVLALKPGITGLAQISGRSNLNFEKEVELDTYYIENWSIWLDIKIIMKTFGVVLTGKTAKDAQDV
ncbi:sugar transferase [bacterium]|nr:sugar transferase [bacterium]